MFRLAWRSVRFNLGRYAATLVAIMTGVAFFAASGFLADRVISALEGDAERQFAGVDAAVVVDADGTGADAVIDDLRIDGLVADEIAALPDVDAVGGELTGDVAFLADDGTVFADGATGRLWVADDELNPIDVDEGAAPEASGEIAVDRGLAADADLEVGDQVTILTLAGQFEVTIMAITSFGAADAQDGDGAVSIPAADAFDWLNAGHVEYSSLWVSGSGNQADLVASIEPFVPAGFDTQTGDELREDKRAEVGSIGNVLKRALQFFSVLALLVGGFVIYNTFNVIVAQRSRELALLAAIGATPKQLKRSMRLEALVIGLLGAALGVVAGLALTFGLVAVLSRLGVDLPGSGLEISTSTVVVAMLFGVIITLVSVTAPAARAGRVEPMEALRQVDAATVGVGRVRTIVALALIALGVLALTVGPAAPFVALGVLALFVGVVLAGPLIAVVGSRLLRPLAGLFGLEGELAADNAARNPARTATTSNALLIGVFLVTFVSVAGTSAKDFAVGEINELSTADFTIESNGGTIDDTLVDDLAAIDGVESVTPFRREAVTLRVGGADQVAANLSTGDLDALVAAAGIDLEAGSYDDLGPGTVVLPSTLASDSDIGATATFTNTDGDSVELTVVGIIGLSLDAFVTGAITEPTTFDAFVGETAPTMGFITTAAGDQSAVEDAIDEITALRPDVGVQAGNIAGRFVGAIFNFMINAVNGLLLMSVIIAVIGIVNTMTLSIIERRRELGLLRAVGMVDRRVRRMVRVESVLIAALGTVSGMLLGIAAGFGLITAIDRLSDAGISISLPPVLLAVILVLGLVLGVAAALIPAQRSTSLDVLDAINAT